MTPAGRLPRRWSLVVAIVVLISLSGPVNAARTNGKLGAVVGPVELVPEGTDPIGIGGLHSYYGSIQLGAFSDGLTVVDELTLERYLFGLQEVPLDWPEEALRAQAIAARTYALWTLGRPRAGSAATYGFDICASVQCQVFAGADVVTLNSLGQRWVDAVQSTESLAILYQGDPILARYHSTSGGRTLSNTEGFPDERGYPYLQPVISVTEKASPLYRWHVRFSLPRVQTMLERAGRWTRADGRLIDVRTTSPGSINPEVDLAGTKAGATLSAEDLRDIARDLAPALWPDDYPSAAPTSSGVLPETLPSHRVTIETKSGVVRVVGRGWGHGVGMSQWGAHGLAQQGASYVDILGHYYTGTTVDRVSTAGNIEVGVATAQSSVTGTGSFRIVDGRGKTIVRHALGTWGFTWAGSGAVAIDPPQGFGLPLEIGIVKAPTIVERGDVAHITVALSRPAKVRTVTQSDTAFEDLPQEIKNAGRQRLTWHAPEEPGTYRVAVRASTGERVRRSDPVRIVVNAPVATPPPEAAEEEDDEEDSSGTKTILLILTIAFAATALIAAVLGRIRR